MRKSPGKTAARAPLSGPRWFAEVFQRPGERHYASLLRLSSESGLCLKTIYRACVHQLRVAPECVDALERLAGKGALDRDSFLSAPTGRATGGRRGRRPKDDATQSAPGAPGGHRRAATRQHQPGADPVRG